MNVSELKKKISHLSDDELRLLILSIASASGIDSSKIRGLTDDIGKTRRTIMMLSDKQLSKLLSSVGKADKNDIISRLGLS